MIEPRKLKGFCDFSPENAAQREQIVSTLRKEATASGFEEISTPALEYAEVLLGSGGDETDKEVYRFEDHGGRKIAMRFDLTVPFARYVAEHQGTMAFPFKKFQVGEVWRGEKPQKGRYRQFCQADVDVIGADSNMADIDVLLCICRTVEKVLKAPFTMKVGNRLLLSALIKSVYGSITPDQENAVLIAIDKLAKIGEQKVLTVISDKAGLPEEKSQLLLDTIKPGESGSTDLTKVRERLTEESLAELDRYEQTVATCSDLMTNFRGKIVSDLSIARGLGYYTGVVFEATVDDLPGFGSVSGGGRYNELVSRFSKRELAGVGGSIGVDRLVAALEALGAKDDAEKKREGVFIAIGDNRAVPMAMQLATSIRDEGVLCEVTSKGGKLAQQFKLADRKRRAHVITLASDEFENQSYSLKNLENGEEKKGIKDLRELLQQI